MRIQEVIRRRLVTEKTTALAEGGNLVAFEVALRAGKRQIKEAVEAQYKGARVAEVRVARMHGKTRRRGRFAGRQPDWKKAYVRLTADSKTSELFESV